MANGFNKEEMVAWEQICEGFDDQLVLSELVDVLRVSDVDMERTSNTMWFPQPYIAQSFSGTDMTSNFVDNTQLSVPATLGYQRSSPWIMTATELRDALQSQRLGDAAKQKLSSDINSSMMTVAANQGTLVVKRTTAATGFDDIALADSIMNEQGVVGYDRMMALSSRDYNGMASNLAARQTMSEIPTKAYRDAYIGRVSSFETFKLDYANRLTLAAGTTVTVNGANQYYTPRATSTAGTGETSNVDNRYQNLTIAVGGGTVKVGDCFTIAGVNSVHHITKTDTGQLKTFRITAIVSGGGGSGVVTISPPIISGGGATAAELQYQNVSATPSNGAAITFLNTATASVNPFWQKGSLALLPGKYTLPTDAGLAVTSYTNSQGITLVMSKQASVDNLKTKFRIDTMYGCVNLNPEMNGIMLFNQV